MIPSPRRGSSVVSINRVLVVGPWIVWGGVCGVNKDPVAPRTTFILQTFALAALRSLFGLRSPTVTHLVNTHSLCPDRLFLFHRPSVGNYIFIVNVINDYIQGLTLYRYRIVILIIRQTAVSAQTIR